jgi:acyl-CoA synthetase (AMP-forming)/AMP-acid ligase II
MIHAEHLEIARELFPNARLHKGYGLTEAIRVAMIDSRDPRFAEPAAGCPLPGQEIAIRDEAGSRLPPGARGRIWVTGPNVMLGYDGAGEAPLAADPEGDARTLDTGDLGYLTGDGRVVVEGRGDGIFKSYGRRIAAAEIERAALGCAAVASALCIAVPCPVRGMRPVLFVESPSSSAESAGSIGLPSPDPRPAIEAALKLALEPYKVPREIVLVESVPRSATGKASRRTLERLWREGAPLADLGRGPLGCHFKRLALAPGPAPDLTPDLNPDLNRIPAPIE